MEKRLKIDEEEIREALTYWLRMEHKIVKTNQRTEKPAILFHHSKDDRASGVFNYHAYIEVEN